MDSCMCIKGRLNVIINIIINITGNTRILLHIKAILSPIFTTPQHLLTSFIYEVVNKVVLAVGYSVFSPCLISNTFVSEQKMWIMLWL